MVGLYVQMFKEKVADVLKVASEITGGALQPLIMMRMGFIWGAVESTIPRAIFG